ncbi:MAG: prephenate dehydrogenase [Thaumarchaeota archaeon]|nr:prephenate dehydrogenase [Nitrososphaerota archaeon]
MAVDLMIEIEKSRLAIVGAGGMARMLVKIFRKSIPDISIISRSLEKARRFSRRLGIGYASLDEIGGFDIVVLTPPSDVLPDVVKSISDRLKAGSLVMDVASIKLGVVDRISPILPESVEYLSIHPLFGPATRRLEGNRVILIPVRGESYLEPIRRVFEEAGLRVTYSSPEEHDRMMAFIQVAHHLSYLSLALTLWRNIGPDKTSDYLTRSLRKTFRMFRMFQANLKVIEEIARLNRFRHDAISSLKESLDELARGEPDAWRLAEEALKIFSEKA